MKLKICVIGVYFGTLPNYFPLWLKSCQKNPMVDFLVFSDQNVERLPANVKIIPMTLREMKERAQRLFDFPIRLERPYKCCDYKVIYGLIFQDYVEKYDYWGHCDFDLIFGDLRFFFEQYELESYDKFLPLGHLCLYRNTKENNNRFLLEGSECGDYKTVYSSDKSFAFDEFRGINKIFEKHGFPMFEKRIFADISKIYKRFRLALDDKNYDQQVFFWRNGKVYRAFFENGQGNEEEFMYIHFKERGKLDYTDECLTSSSFFISNKGFYQNEKQTLTLEDVEKYNQFKGASHEKVELIKLKLCTFVSKIKNKMFAVAEIQKSR